MTERPSSSPPPAHDVSGRDTPSGENAAGSAELDHLRSLLFQRELAFLRALECRLEDPAIQAREVSNVLAEAVLLRAGRDDRLSVALQPTVEQIFRSSVRRHPEQLASSLFPLMGPAIRKSIAEAINSMLQGLNKALETAFSWRGLRWRIEGWRTGKSFAEVVLLHTLVYRVEQVFLIHPETGILLGHATGEGVDHQDADLVSGMLTAVQDFVRDCFTQGSGDSLDAMRMGELTLMVEKGPAAVLACLVRGDPPASFRGKLREAVEIIHVEGAERLAEFTGDVSVFFPLLRHLEACLDARYVDGDRPLPLLLRCLPALLLALALGLGGYLWWRGKMADETLAALRADQAARQARFLDAVRVLENVPGIVLVETSGNPDAGWTITLLRDPLSADPRLLLAEKGLTRDRYRMETRPFASLEPEMVTARIRRAMSPPPGVDINFSGGVLALSGTAPFDWILATTEKALGLPGVERVDTSGISDPRVPRLKELLRRVEDTKIEFPMGKDMPAPDEQRKLADAVDKLAEVAKLCDSMGLAATLLIYGHADPSGTDKRNYELSTARATTFASMLYSRGVAMPVATYGFGSEYSAPVETKTGLPSSVIRRVELRVHIASQGKSLITSGRL